MFYFAGWLSQKVPLSKLVGDKNTNKNYFKICHSHINKQNKTSTTTTTKTKTTTTTKIEVTSGKDVSYLLDSLINNKLFSSIDILFFYV